MELIGTVVLVLFLAAVLVALLCGWYYHMSKGGFWNFWMAFNLMDAAGKIATLLLTILVNSISNDS